MDYFVYESEDGLGWVPNPLCLPFFHVKKTASNPSSVRQGELVEISCTIRNEQGEYIKGNIKSTQVAADRTHDRDLLMFSHSMQDDACLPTLRKSGGFVLCTLQFME